MSRSARRRAVMVVALLILTVSVMVGTAALGRVLDSHRLQLDTMEVHEL